MSYIFNSVICKKKKNIYRKNFPKEIDFETVFSFLILIFPPYLLNTFNSAGYCANFYQVVFIQYYNVYYTSV